MSGGAGSGAGGGDVAVGASWPAGPGTADSLCLLNLHIAESVPFARGGEQLRHLGTNLVQRQCQCGRDRSGLEGEIELVDELIG